MSEDGLKRFEVTRTDTSAMKAVAIALMVCHHAFLWTERLSNGNGYDSLFVYNDGLRLESSIASFGKICVALFMLLSGYGISKSMRSKPQPVSLSVVSETIGKRIKGLFIRWWQVLAVFIPLAYIINAEASNQTVMDWLKSIFFIDFLPNKEVWFAPPYILMMCMIPFIIRWFERKNANVWSDGILIAVFNAFGLMVFSQVVESLDFLEELRNNYFYDQMYLMIQMLPMFLTGWFLAKYQLIEKTKSYFSNGIIKRVVGIILICLTYCFRVWNYSGTRNLIDYVDYIYAAVFMIGVLLLIDGLDRFKACLAYVGKYSTGMWMIHSFFCYYYFQDFTYSTRNPIVIFLTIFVFSFICAFLISNAFGYIWKKLKKGVYKSDSL